MKILFSDKTGTLTKNEMILQQCSINGRKYRIQNFGVQEEHSSNVMRLPHYDRDLLTFFQTLSVCHTVQVAKVEPNEKNKSESDAESDDMDKSFEMVDSIASLVDIEDVKRKKETRQNTKQNEMCVPDNILEGIPACVERKYWLSHLN